MEKDAPVFSWLTLPFLLDSALPVGSFAHSYGLETLVQGGSIRTGEELRLYLEGMIRFNWATSDAMVIKAVYSGWERGDPFYALRVERLVHYQRLGAETREGLEKTGRRLLRLALAVWPNLSLDELRRTIKDGSSLGTYPFVFGELCRRLSVPLDRAGEGYLYASTTNAINAALRLMSIGQNETQRILASTFPFIEKTWQDVREMNPEEAYGAMPLSEMATIGHARLYSRLFMS